MRVLGAGFQPQITANFDDPTQTSAAVTFTARLGDRALDAMKFVSTTELRAVVPAGLVPGVYDLELVDPQGRRGGLKAAFIVLPPGEAGSGDGPRADRGPRDGPRSEQPRDLKKVDQPQPASDLGPCPAACIGGCGGGTCHLSCSAGCTCPPGLRCDIQCGGGGCTGPIDCSQATHCNIDCSSNSCTKGIVCGAGSCHVECGGGACTGPIDCSKSCACSIECNGGCSGSVLCPAACKSGCKHPTVCGQC